MQTHHFTLIVEGPDMQDEVVIDALFENGCDDGTVGRSDDVQFIVFDREAASLVEAVQSAIDDIERTPELKGHSDCRQQLDFQLRHYRSHRGGAFR